MSSLAGGLHQFPAATCAPAYSIMDPTPGFEGAFQHDTLVGVLTDLGWGSGDPATPATPRTRLPTLAHD